MPRKTTLYIDIDDTIIAQVLPGSGFDLRPGAMTQLRVLSLMYDCCWLTAWPHFQPMRPESGDACMTVATLMSCLYGTVINERFRYAEWDRDHPDGKAGFVLRESESEDWYWLEDPLFKEEELALAAAGKLDRYICVEPTGQWGFLNAVHELFRRSGKTNVDLQRAGGQPEWFNRDFFSSASGT
jgi:hypothetical protein